MIKKLFLLDAYALIYRSYYAFIRNPRFSSSGLNTSAIFGFTNTLLDIIENQQPTHIAIVFDPPTPTFRHVIYPQYKANREETPEDIRRSVPYIKMLADALNIAVIQIDNFEADDVIGTLAIKARRKGFEVYMMTPDKDYAQIVQDSIFMYKPGRSGAKAEIWGVEEVKQKFEINHPGQVRDILALMGDSSDNIPGAKGIGEKTAIKLIHQFGSVESLMENISMLNEKIKENINLNKNNILLSKQLVTIEINVPVNLDEDVILYRPPNQEKINALFNELEFRTLLSRIIKTVPAKNDVSTRDSYGQLSLFDQPIDAIHNDNIKRNINTVQHTYFLADTPEQRKNLIQMLNDSSCFCFDTETTGLEVHIMEIVGLSVSFKPFTGWYIPLPEDQNEARKILNEFAGVFANKNISKIGQNIKFDIQVLHKYGIRVNGFLFDTMIAHYLIEPELRHNMDYLAESYLNYSPVPIESLIGEKGKHQRSMRSVAIDLIKDYACEDADITFQLREVFMPILKKNNLDDLYKKIEEPLINVLADIELTGVKIDPETLISQRQLLTNELLLIEEDIYKDCGERFNISSPQQLGHILFEKLKIISNPAKTKTKQYSTGEEILEKLIDNHPVISKILEYRGLKKLLNTYIEVLPSLINTSTGKVHTSFNQTITSTGRLSSNNPNLQNIPIREQRGREIRRAFIPSSANHILLSADYSQIELRIMAHLSQDANMIAAFKSNMDIHIDTAARIFIIPHEQVTSDMRRKAKTANFGIIYGISAFGLASRLNISRKEAKELIEGYFNSYPGVKKYMADIINTARTMGFVQTLFNRRRYLKDINSNNATVRGFAERNAINAPIQGTAADIIKLAMIDIYQQFCRENLKSKMILQVHDELVFDVLRTELDLVKELVKHTMETIVQLDVPLLVKIGVGENWLEAH